MDSGPCLLTTRAPGKASRTAGAALRSAGRLKIHAANRSRGRVQRDRAVALGTLDDRELGRGRSGTVYSSRDDIGRPIARKVFGASGLTKVVQYIFLGAPNPYLWCESAVRTAILRRRILSELVEVWFGSKLRVARAYDYEWNEISGAFEIRCELIEGRHVALHHPYTSPDDCELQDAVRKVMKPLQSRLAEAGFDGMVWQAGRGNPVALNNFMSEGPDGNGGCRWVWIDLESGVPALIPLNPVDLLLFYLPKSLRHGRALFDDVDMLKLRAYMKERREEIEEGLGGERVRKLEADIDALECSQREWKSPARYRRSISYRHATGSINRQQADWYARHPLRWYGSESLHGFRAAWSVAATFLAQVAAAVARIKLRRWFKTCWTAIRSQQYRTRLARDYVAVRIANWQTRGQLKGRDADLLRSHLQAEEASSYLSDFGVHLAVKPLVKTMEWWVVPGLWMGGVVGAGFLGVFLVAAGPCVRTLYTLIRIAQNALTGREKPWVALLVGAVPVVGNLAYPLQIIASGANAHASVAQFILYDTMSRLGQWLPIWGGPDTRIEHVLNRLPHIALRSRRGAPESPAGMTCADRSTLSHARSSVHLLPDNRSKQHNLGVPQMNVAKGTT